MEQILLDLFEGISEKENITAGYDEVASYFDEVNLTFNRVSE